MDAIPGDDSGRPISVSELNRRARLLLEQGIARLWVEGEISNLARPASGHVYFSLKDQDAQLRCAWFRQRQRGPTIGLKNGDQVLALGKVSIYEARGDYQLIVEGIEPAGEGVLRRRFELLKKKLEAEGLFARELKRPLPALPRCIGVVTSPTGAALHDILTVLRRRFPAVPVVIYPAAVQGDAAVPELTAAIADAGRRRDCDVLIVGRGGGSLEDLWAFNEEAVARAIRACPIPVVSAVGHEVDVTIADFAADLRAPTPSGAAELVVPDGTQWLRSVDLLRGRLVGQMRRALDDLGQQLDWLGQRLAVSSPLANVRRQGERLAATRRALAGAMKHDLATRRHRLERLQGRLLRHAPAARIQRTNLLLAGLRRRLSGAAADSVERCQHRLALVERSLHAVSPLSTLERGYAIVTDAATGHVLSDSAAAPAGTTISARLFRGSVDATVTRSRPDADDD